MLALDTRSVTYFEFNIICVIVMAGVTLYASNYLKSIQMHLSKFLGGMVALYSTVFILDAVRYRFDIVGWPSENVAAVIAILCSISSILSATAWFLYAITRLHPETEKKFMLYCVASMPACLLVLYSLALAFVDVSFLDENGHMLYPASWFNVQNTAILIYYVGAILLAISYVVKNDKKTNRYFALLVAVFPVPYIIATLGGYFLHKNYKVLGICISFVMFINIVINLRQREQAKELTHFANIMDSIKNQYSSILYTNLTTNEIEPYIVINKLENKSDEINRITEYDKMIKGYANNFVYSSDVELFLEKLDRENLARELEDKEMTSIEYRIAIEGEVRYMRLECWKAKNEKGIQHVVMGFVDITERKVKERQDERKNSIIHALVNSFEYVCYLNYGNGDFEEYYVSKKFDYFFSIVGETEGFKRFVSLFKHGMDKDEYTDFRERFDQNVILDGIMEDGTFTMDVNLNLGNGIRHYNIIAIGQESNPEVAIFGIVDIDDQVKAEIEKKERIKEREYSIQLEKTISERTAELHEKARSLNQINEDITELLGNITEARDVESGTHIKRVKGYTKILANHIKEDYPEYGLDDEQIQLITSASALHDVGKIMIPDSILRKPGKFTSDEFDVMKTHCEKGCDILKMAPKGWDKRYLDFSLEICRYHHEKWNGKGYPEGLYGDNIPISAQIVSVADCFDALTTKRVYKGAYAPEEALNMILNGECGEFSDKMLDALRKSKDEFYAYFDGDQKVEIEIPVLASVKSLKDVSIMLVEDNELTREITTEILEDEGASVTALSSGTEVIELLEKADQIEYDAILMDLSLPDMDGFEVTRRIRSMEVPRASVVPVIAVTSSTDRQDMQRAFDEKMSAYMPKPISIANLTQILLSSMRSEQKNLSNRLDEAIMRANKDPLTGVKNMTAYTEAIGEITNKIANKEELEFAIVMCDVNKLKVVNDTYGHDCGDRYIRNCCKLICQTYSHSPVYRVGGDEFAVILMGEDYKNRNELIDELGGRIAAASKLERIEDGKARMAAGMSVYNPYSDYSVASVAKRADESMYTNKRMMEFGGQY